MTDRLKQLHLSLLNATLMLGIILVLLALLLLDRAQSFTTNVVSDVKFGLLQEIDKDVKEVVGSIRETDRDLRRVADGLDRLIAQPEIALSPESREDIRSLEAKLTGLRDGVSQLLSSHESVSDRAVREIASRLGEVYIALRHCRREAAPTAAP